ncbi:MAG: fumarylacetoacetate hydrolase family protein [Pseudomonadales bacterium]
MTDMDLMAKAVDDAARNVTAIEQLSVGETFSLDEAYAIQERSISYRLARGESLVGIKVGFTSRAKMIQMNVSDLIWGRLTDAMQLEEGGDLDLSTCIHPRIEPEVAFLLKKPLSGNVTAPQAMAAVEAVAPAMEIIDSRYKNFQFSLEDVVADNSSSSGFVIGPWRHRDIEVGNLGMVMEFNSRPVQIGSSAAILGHPVRSLVAAARLAAASGLQLEPGWVIMAGAATAAEAITPATHVRTLVERLGSVAINVRANST